MDRFTEGEMGKFTGRNLDTPETDTGLLPVLNVVPHLQPDGSSLLTATTVPPALSLSQFFVSPTVSYLFPPGKVITKCCHFTSST